MEKLLYILFIMICSVMVGSFVFRLVLNDNDVEKAFILSPKTDLRQEDIDYAQIEKDEITVATGGTVKSEEPAEDIDKVYTYKGTNMAAMFANCTKGQIFSFN